MLTGTLDNRLQMHVTVSPQDVEFLDQQMLIAMPERRTPLKGKLQRAFAPRAEPLEVRMYVREQIGNIMLEAYPREIYAKRYDIIISQAELELLKERQELALLPKTAPGYALTVRVQDEPEKKSQYR